LSFIIFLTKSEPSAKIPPITKLHQHEDRGTLKALCKSWKPFLMVLGVTSGGSLAFYTITTYTKTFMENTGMDKMLVNNLFLGALFILMIIQP
ncbi:hypothetical protein DDV82_10040, partial [Campylobacter jejuni]